MNPSTTIPTTPLEHPAMDYAFLRREGIRLLERLGSQMWTDFNAHDPGITILEQLCYAITDLGYRINYDIKDLLTASDEDPYRSLYSPAKVLTINPITMNDLRKLVIDVEGVKNAWIETVTAPNPALVYDPSELAIYIEGSTPQPPHRRPVPLRGLYKILIETDENLGLHPAEILPEVNSRLYACRSLGEDFTPPTILRRQSIIVRAKVEIGSVEDPEKLLAEIYLALSEAISPRIRFYTLDEMLARGLDIDEIFDGPALQHGFLDNAELEQFQRKIGLRTSDLLQRMMDVPGVSAVSNISLSGGGESEDWYLKLDPERAPFIDMDKSLFDTAGPTIRLTRSGIPIQLDPTRVRRNIEALQKMQSEGPLPESQRDIQLAPGHNRRVGQYHSIQHQFPALYGIGNIGLPESASPERHAQSKQLKAYLMFFDQLLANYFAQLDNAKELFSFYTQDSRSYFAQAISDATLGLDEIRVNASASYAANVQALTEDTSTSDSPAGRKNRFLNHLLARFAEQFTDYSLLQYAHLDESDLIADKAAFLQDYQAIGARRGNGFDYTQTAENTDNLSGLEKRISRKLGISNYARSSLSELNTKGDGGFYLLEHILLRPHLVDRGQQVQTSSISWQTAYLALPAAKDPYSHQISFVFPNWLERFNRAGFRELIEKTLREETPAHLHVYIHWLNQADMLAFESAQKTCREAALIGRYWDPITISSDDDAAMLNQLQLRDARDRMVQILGIGIPYPLRDLKLNYVATVAYNQPANIQLLGGQEGVRYQLCDEDGNAILDAGKTLEVTPQPGQAMEAVFLKTPKITKDITFTILASREAQAGEIHLETYLNRAVAIKAGIDTQLPVSFQPAAGQMVSGTQITTNYNDKVTVVISNTQEGISYKLVSGPQDNLTTLSTSQKGNTTDVVLVSTSGFAEDTPIYVQAFRPNSKQDPALLETTLSIKVRPNPALTINVDKLIVDYQSAATLTVLAAQTSTEYRLFKRDLTLGEYLPDGTAGALSIRTDEGRNIAVKVPATVTDWGNPAGFTLVDTFKVNGANVTVSTGNLLEDTLFIVQATKIENREQLQLTQTVAVLVRPNPGPAVSVAQASVASDSLGLVQLNGTQKGVGYQLRLDPANTPVNPLGYHLTDRGINTMRLEVDLLVEDQGKPVLLLPTGTLTQVTNFNILAIKTITGVSAQLATKATINITS